MQLKRNYIFYIRPVFKMFSCKFFISLFILYLIFPYISINDGGDAILMVSPFCNTHNHQSELSGNYPAFTVVMIIYNYIEIIWRIFVNSKVWYNIYNNETILYRWTSSFKYAVIKKYYQVEQQGNNHKKG